MNNSLFCFIACVSDEELYRESLFYINRLDIPQGFSIECHAVKNADSITSGYNLAMGNSDAKYKVYMHQDINILNKRFLYDLLEIFASDGSIGMVGVVGSADIPDSGIFWESEHGLGCLYSGNSLGTVLMGSSQNNYKHGEAMIIDGVLMATQYDLPWREDIIDNWHFYDASQSCEFLRKGYKLFVPDQHDPDGNVKPWCLHDTTGAAMAYYEKYRSKFLKEYSDFFPESIKDISKPESDAISVVLMVRGHYSYLRERVDEIVERTPDTVNEIIVIVDRLDESPPDWLKRNGIKIMLTEPDEGAASILRRAIALINKQNDVFLMHCQVPYIWNSLRTMTTALCEKEDTGVVFLAVGEPSPEVWLPSNKVESWFTLYKRPALEKADLFDEQFTVLSHAVYDHGLSLMQAGYKLLKCNAFQSVPQPDESDDEIKLGRSKFKEKWGFLPD